jgi:hypothetical protein
MLEHTSTAQAPWFVIPADDKWFTRLVLANIIVSELGKLDLKFPVVPDVQLKQLQEAKKLLTGETDSPAGKTED